MYVVEPAVAPAGLDNPDEGGRPLESVLVGTGGMHHAGGCIPVPARLSEVRYPGLSSAWIWTCAITRACAYQDVLRFAVAS
jgi:hypothetical protein